MKAKEADGLNEGDTVYANFGGWPQECTVLYVRKERRCRRIGVRFTRKDGHTVDEEVRHGNAWM